MHVNTCTNILNFFQSGNSFGAFIGGRLFGRSLTYDDHQTLVVQVPFLSN